MTGAAVTIAASTAVPWISTWPGLPAMAPSNTPLRLFSAKTPVSSAPSSGPDTAPSPTTAPNSDGSQG